ncbi:gtr1 g domain containing protein [Lasallia pustulata]|uniref:GTP-binding protein n=1 Tax=Lasallia pustulata TaxID=136370 RepID=A0A1W5DDY0_9LECA|nr:gtr1 g domain containing protein [Lasallia pustulata]
MATKSHTVTEVPTNDSPTSANLAATRSAEHKPRLLLMGQKRSGKSSISNVVFHKMAPTETLFIEATTAIKKEAMHSFMEFQVWDIPGQIDYLEPSFDADGIFGGVGAMIWVLDAQDSYLVPILNLVETILHLQQTYPDIKYAVFIHKVDSLTDDFRLDTIRDINQRITDELMDAGLENPPVSFYPTSIFDHSIFEAFSKVIQVLVPQLPTLEALLNTVAAGCRMEKVYLFDVLSKIYIASDTSPVDMAAYELCSDWIDTIVDMSEIYAYQRESEGAGERDGWRQSAESTVGGVRGSSLYLKEINT